MIEKVIEMRFAALILAAVGLAAQQAPTGPLKPPVDDDVTAYLQERRARQTAIGDLYSSAEGDLKAGKYERAAATFRQLEQFDPGNNNAIEGLVDVYLAQNRREDAFQLLQREVVRQPGSTRFIDLLADTAVGLGSYDQAIEALVESAQQLRNRTPLGAPQIYLAIGKLYLSKKDPESAISAFRKALELDPTNTQTALLLARTLNDAGRTAEAAAAYRTALGVDTADSEALIDKAATLMQRNGDLEGALICLQFAKAAAPQDPTIANLLAELYMRKGLPQDALPVLRDLVTEYPKSAFYHFDLARALLQQEDRTEAIKELQSALQCNPSDELKNMIESGMRSIQKQ